MRRGRRNIKADVVARRRSGQGVATLALPLYYRHGAKPRWRDSVSVLAQLSSLVAPIDANEQPPVLFPFEHEITHPRSVPIWLHGPRTWSRRTLQKFTNGFFLWAHPGILSQDGSNRLVKL
jgi:hypothetical protein